jgi:dolichyl-phosphate-mannose-protein mannosyltransferase
MSGQTTRLLLVLVIVGAALHLFRLSSPPRVVFDEVHFGSFVDAYCCSHAYFFDIHPPHAKLLITGAVTLGGYRGGQKFADLGGPFTSASPALFRLVPALAGIAIPLMLFAWMRQLGASTWAAFLAGLAAALDNALLVQTRVVALDGILLAAIFGALVCHLASERARSRARRTAFALAAGGLAGLAAGTKFTGLAAIALIGLLVAVELLRAPGRPALRRAASQTVWILAGAAAVYVAGWEIHYALLTEPGQGYVWGAPTGDFLHDAVKLHRNMLASNYGLKAPHPYESKWWSWPLMLRSVFYWNEDDAAIYFLGNPVLWWGTTLGLLMMGASVLAMKVTRLEIPGAAKPWPPRLWVPLAGYAIAYVPLMRVPRALFLYHYLTPLLFALCAVLLWLDHAGFTRPGGWREQRRSFRRVIAALVVGFLLMTPFTYAFIEAPAYRSFWFGIFPSWQ